MNDDAMVFAMANPNPEVSPEEAAPYARIIATGRSDYPNQINNVLAFPGIFRGALDVRARAITEDMKVAAARAIADIVPDAELREDYIIPSVFNRDVAARGRRGRGGVRAPGRHRAGRRGDDRLRQRRRRAVRRRLSPADPRAPGWRVDPHMNVTITGATGLIGTKLVAGPQGAGRRGHRPLPQPGEGGRGARRARPSPGTRPRDRPPPVRSPAATRSSTSPASPSPSAGTTRSSRRSMESRETGHPQPRRGHRGRATRSPRSSSPPPPSATTASTATRSCPRPRPPGDDFLAGVCVAWEREADAAAAARPARREDPHRRRARRGRRRAEDDAAAVQAGRRRPGGRRQAVHAVDPRRRHRRPLPQGARRHELERRLQRLGARARHEQDVLQGARQGAAPPGVLPGARASRSSCSTATWPRSSSRASARCPSACSPAATPSRGRSSSRRSRTHSASSGAPPQRRGRPTR